MNKARRAFLIGFLILFAPIANATPIVVGTYIGSWSQSLILGTVTMTISDQIAAGGDTDNVAGIFDWLCVTVVACSGQELFSGTLTGNTLNLAGFQLLNNVNLALSFYTATVSPDGKNVAGTFAATAGGRPLGPWTVTRVPEPSTLFLLGSALVGFLCCRRRRKSEPRV